MTDTYTAGALVTTDDKDRALAEAVLAVDPTNPVRSSSAVDAAPGVVSVVVSYVAEGDNEAARTARAMASVLSHVGPTDSLRLLRDRTPVQT